MEHFGLRRVLIGALLLMAASSAASAFMTESWHLLLTWGVFSGIGSGRWRWSWARPSSIAGSPRAAD